MIVLKGNRKYIQSLGNEFWTVWKGFIQHVNKFNHKNNNISNLLRYIDILRGIILEKDTNTTDTTDELRKALTALSTILHNIRVQITFMDTGFSHLNKMDFAVQKGKLEQLVVQARRNLMLVASDLKNVDFSRRKFISNLGRTILGIAGTAAFGLSLQTDSEVLERIVLTLEQDNEAEVIKIFKSVSVPFTGQVKPTIIVQIPKHLEESFKEAKNDKELREELQQYFIESIRAIRKREHFTPAQSKNAITYVHHENVLNLEGLSIKKKTEDHVGTSIFTENVINSTLQNRQKTIYGLILSVYHGLHESSYPEIYFKGRPLLAPSFKVIAYCKEYDLALYLFVPLFEEVQEKVGVRFTTTLKEDEEVYLLRYPSSPNYAKHGPIARGKVLINSYFHSTMQTVDLAIATLETYKGDSGSPIFNKNGDVVGIVHGGLEYQTVNKKGSVCAFIRSEYVLRLLAETERFFMNKLQ